MTEKRFWEFNITGADDYTLYIGVKDSQTGKYYHTKDVENARELKLLLNALHEENEQLREHFIYLIGTALEDKECRKIYAKGLLEIFDDCDNLDEAKIKIKEYLE